jgi:hypothetical protein
VVLGVLAAVAPGALGGHGAKTKPEGPLRWQAPARTSALAGAAGDHLLFGRVVNHSAHAIRLKAADVHVLLRTGAAAPVSASFTAAGDARAVAIEYDGGRLALK